ncbi:CBS domain-containing protein [Yoonia sp.]|uniref:CBS domain-containing protein n=1 Tax=Yoonia sp. TaxID=2212373 RepID=UPI0035900101
MSGAWASPTAIDLDVISSVQRGLVVGLIMTPRGQVMTCKTSDSIAALLERNVDRYSFIPVVNDEERYIGLFDASRWFDKTAPDTPIETKYQPLSEDLMIGADASIFDFVVSADAQPMRLVVSGEAVAGVISLSDLQQLPVRAALFTLITALEMAMARRIEAEWGGDSQRWMKLISEERRASIEAKIKEVREADGYVSDIALSQFADKAMVICKARLIEGTRKSIKRSFKDAEDLRNQLAHSGYYAETPTSAANVSAVVRSILEIKTALLPGLEERGSEGNTPS